MKYKTRVKTSTVNKKNAETNWYTYTLSNFGQI